MISCKVIIAQITNTCNLWLIPDQSEWYYCKTQWKVLQLELFVLICCFSNTRLMREQLLIHITGLLIYDFEAILLFYFMESLLQKQPHYSVWYISSIFSPCCLTSTAIFLKLVRTYHNPESLRYCARIILV